MDDLDNAVRQAIYRAFVDSGRAPVAAEVAEILGAPLGDVEASFRRLHEQHVIVLAPGSPYIWMANPLSALPTAYEVDVGDKRFWGNCIWDSLGIVAMLGTEGRVRAPCPDCGERLIVEVRDGSIRSDGELVHYAIPAARWWDSIGST